MRFIAEDNPNLYIDVKTYSELEETIEKWEDFDNYNYEVIFDFSLFPQITGKIRAIKKYKNN